MRRIRVAAPARVVRLLLALSLAVWALTPFPAAAEDGVGSYEGTYVGSATGAESGKSLAITVWVKDLGSETKFWAQAAPEVKGRRIKVVVDVVGTEQMQADGSVTVALTVNKLGINGSGTVVLKQEGGTWVLDGSGSGSAFGKSGSGIAACTRTSTRVNPPGIGQQVMDVFRGVLGLGEEDTDGADTTVVTDPGPVSPVAPVEPQPPLTTDDKLVAAGLAILVLIMEILLA